MSEQLLDLLKLCLLALLYLFFLRVMWAVFSELRAPAPVATGRDGADGGGAAGSGRRTKRPKPAKAKATKKQGGARSGGAGTLHVIEPASMIGTTYPIGAEMTIGRAPGCAIAVDDTYLSQMHARVFVDDTGTAQVEDLGSTNGTSCNGEAVHGPRPLRPGDRLQAGGLVMEVR